MSPGQYQWCCTPEGNELLIASTRYYENAALFVCDSSGNVKRSFVAPDHGECWWSAFPLKHDGVYYLAFSDAYNLPNGDNSSLKPTLFKAGDNWEWTSKQISGEGIDGHGLMSEPITIIGGKVQTTLHDAGYPTEAPGLAFVKDWLLDEWRGKASRPWGSNTVYAGWQNWTYAAGMYHILWLPKYNGFAYGDGTTWQLRNLTGWGSSANIEAICPLPRADGTVVWLSVIRSSTSPPTYQVRLHEWIGSAWVHRVVYSYQFSSDPQYYVRVGAAIDDRDQVTAYISSPERGIDIWYMNLAVNDQPSVSGPYNITPEYSYTMSNVALDRGGRAHFTAFVPSVGQTQLFSISEPPPAWGVWSSRTITLQSGGKSWSDDYNSINIQCEGGYRQFGKWAP